MYETNQFTRTRMYMRVHMNTLLRLPMGQQREIGVYIEIKGFKQVSKQISTRCWMVL